MPLSKNTLKKDSVKSQSRVEILSARTYLYSTDHHKPYVIVVLYSYSYKDILLSLNFIEGNVTSHTMRNHGLSHCVR